VTNCAVGYEKLLAIAHLARGSGLLPG